MKWILREKEIILGQRVSIPYENDRPQLTFGPLFFRSDCLVGHDPRVEPLGVTLEMATEVDSFRTHLFHKISRFGSEVCTLTDVLIHEADLPFEFQYRPCFAVEASEGMYVPLESFLVALFREFQVPRSIFAILTELRDMVSFCGGGSRVYQVLVPEVSALGFAVTSIHSYGRQLCVDLDWIPPQDRFSAGLPRPMQVDAVAIDFRPLADGSLGTGKWVKPKDCFARVLLYQELRGKGLKAPIELFTESGKQELLTHFQWTPLARLTNRQAREERIRFIGQHPELSSDLPALADALQKAGLYSENTSRWQVLKFLPSLVAASMRTAPA